MEMKILVPTDLSNSSLPGIQLALLMAEGLRAEIHLLYVLDTRGDRTVPLPSGFDVDSEEWQREMRLQARAAMEALPLVQSHPARVTCHTTLGIPWAEIVTWSKTEGMDLIVMSTHGRTGFQHLLMGSVAERVIRGAECPVITIRGMAEDLKRLISTAAGAPDDPVTVLQNWSPRHILVSIDLAESSVGVLNQAAALANAFDSDLTLVHVLEVGRAGLAALVEEYPADKLEDRLLERGFMQMKAFLEGVEDQLEPRVLGARRVIRLGEPVPELEAACEALGADMLVLGKHGRRMGRRWWMGSVSERVVRSAQIPIVVVPSIVDLESDEYLP